MHACSHHTLPTKCIPHSHLPHSHIWWLTLCQRYVIARLLPHTLLLSPSVYFSVFVLPILFIYIHFHISGLSFDLSSVKLVVTLLLKRCSVAIAHTYYMYVYMAMAIVWLGGDGGGVGRCRRRCDPVAHYLMRLGASSAHIHSVFIIS